MRKYLPSGEELKKRQRTHEESLRRAKKAKIDVPAKAITTVEEEEEIYGEQERKRPKDEISIAEDIDPIKETQEFIVERLSSEFASNLVLTSMVRIKFTKFAFIFI